MMYFFLLILFIVSLVVYFFRLYLFLFPKNRLPILMYHNIAETSENELTVSKENLEKQLSYLSKAKYKTLFFGELENNLSSKTIFLTFDDGYRSNEVFLLPLLKKYHFKATIFIPSSRVGKDDDKMNFEELRNLDTQYIELALHSHRHKNYSEMSVEDTEADLRENIATLEKEKIPFTKVLAYPYGKYPKKNPDFMKMLENLNIQYALRIGNNVNYFPTKKPFQLCRISIDGSDTLLKFRLKLIFGKLKL